MDFKPLFDRILVEPLTAEQTVGGLYIPDSSTNLKKGIVQSAGEGKTSVPKHLVAKLKEIKGKLKDNGLLQELGNVITELEKPYMIVRVNQEVLFDKEDGTDITLEGKHYLIMKENVVWMVK